MLGFKLISLYTVQPIFTQFSKLVPSSVILPPINQYFHPTGNESDIRIQLTPIYWVNIGCTVYNEISLNPSINRTRIFVWK
jgi:hypothetical protein